MRRPALILSVAAVACVAVWLAGCRGGQGLPPPAQCTDAPRAPRLEPDLAGVTIPVNIAPLNFIVREPGVAYHLTLRHSAGEELQLRRRSGNMKLPPRAWRRLLASAPPGSTLTFLLHARDAQGQWTRFQPVTVLAGPEIDRYLVYRYIGPIYSFFWDVRIRQRDLQTQADTDVLRGTDLNRACVNCHTFDGNQTGRMTFGVRSEVYGNAALVVVDGQVTRMGTTWGYNSWHPSGQAVAYSLNKVRQFFHDAGHEVRDVVDLDSDIVIYRTENHAVEADASIADPDRLETYPMWSPDGRYLYYCSAPITWTDRDTVPPKGWGAIRYDLRRVSYDLASHTFGQPEVLLSAAETGKSILLPRPSPDGRWLLFCMCDYGCFPIYQPGSDLYLMDLRTRAVRRLDLNSDQSEAWHCWSSNGRWIAFSSKRQDGVFTRTYFAHVDEGGRVHKPFVLPQEDPQADLGRLRTYTVPELVKTPVPTTPRQLARSARSGQPVKLQMPDISMTRKQAPTATDAWKTSPTPGKH